MLSGLSINDFLNKWLKLQHYILITLIKSFCVMTPPLR